MRHLRLMCATCLTRVASSHCRTFPESALGLPVDSQSSRGPGIGPIWSGCAVWANHPIFSAVLRGWARSWPSACMRHFMLTLWSSSKLHYTRTMSGQKFSMSNRMPDGFSAIHKTRELARAIGMAQFLKCLRLDLTDALTCHSEYPADLFECVFWGAANAETHA